MDFDPLKVGVKQAMMAQARRCALVADSSKFARTAIVRVAPLSAFAMLVTEARPPEPLAQHIEEDGCRLVIGRRV